MFQQDTLVQEQRPEQRMVVTLVTDGNKFDCCRNGDETENKNLIQNANQHLQSKRCSYKGIIAQCVMTGAVMISSASCGLPIGYSAVLLPQLKLSNDSMKIDDDIGSWIASVHSAATPVGCILSGILMDKFGRKMALQISSIPLIVGWFLICFSTNHGILLAGRLVAGIAAGLTAAPGQVLIGEISEPRVRGIFTSVPFASYSFGILLVYAMGSWLHWRLVAGLCTILPIMAVFIFFFLPESPVWLSRRGKLDEARQSLTWLRGGDVLQAKVEIQQLFDRISNDSQQSNRTSWRAFADRHVLKPFVIINVFNLMQILSGTYLVVFYAVDILANMSEGNFDNFLAAVLTACVRFLFTLIASALLGMIGRRVLAITSGLGTAISALCLGTFLYLQGECKSDHFAALFLFFYVAANTVGFMILPGVMLGELYPAKIRGLAGGLTFATFNVLLFGIAKMFPVLKNELGIHGVFWLFGGSSLLASVFLYLMLPETKGKTLGQIEDYFLQKNLMWITRHKGETDKAAKTETV